jgi:hypothetical protein
LALDLLEQPLPTSTRRRVWAPLWHAQAVRELWNRARLVREVFNRTWGKVILWRFLGRGRRMRARAQRQTR